MLDIVEIIRIYKIMRFSLLKQYQSTRTDFEVMRELVEKKQQVGESIDSYFHTMLTLRARLRTPIPDYEMIKILKGNIRENLARMIYPMTIYSIEQLREECKEIEIRFPKRDVRAVPPQQVTRYPNRQHINEILTEMTPEDEENSGMMIDALAQRERREVRCWNCKVSGHTYMECESAVRNIFCYKCGLERTITPKCPNCNQENKRRSVAKTGESRSTQTSVAHDV